MGLDRVAVVTPSPAYESYFDCHFFLTRSDGMGFCVCLCVCVQGIMLVYDVTTEKSFENIRNWIRNIEEVSQTSDW